MLIDLAVPFARIIGAENEEDWPVESQRLLCKLTID
jgi:hypothetical protein